MSERIYVPRRPYSFSSSIGRCIFTLLCTFLLNSRQRIHCRNPWPECQRWDKVRQSWCSWTLKLTWLAGHPCWPKMSRKYAWYFLLCLDIVIVLFIRLRNNTEICYDPQNWLGIFHKFRKITRYFHEQNLICALEKYIFRDVTIDQNYCINSPESSLHNSHKSTQLKQLM